MWKTPKFIVTAVLVATILVCGTAAAVLAQDNHEGQGRRGALMARVAEILKVDEQELEDAFKQALSELREEGLDNRLLKLVDEGTLDQGQADQFKAWIEARPDIPMVGPRVLARLQDEGILTQEQVDEHQAWIEAKPDIPLPKPEGPRHLHPRFGHGCRGGHGEMPWGAPPPDSDT